MNLDSAIVLACDLQERTGQTYDVVSDELGSCRVISEHQRESYCENGDSRMVDLDRIDDSNSASSV